MSCDSKFKVGDCVAISSGSPYGGCVGQVICTSPDHPRPWNVQVSVDLGDHASSCWFEPTELKLVEAASTAEERITDPTTGGQKGIKPERFDLLPFEALEDVARVYAYGSKKYADHNWRKGYKWSLSSGALLRHVSRWMCGEDYDKESGLHHLAHAAFHCLSLVTFSKLNLGTDDRPTRG